MLWRIDRIDRGIFRVVESLVLKYVRRKKYTRHKYDLRIKMREIKVVVLSIIVFVCMPIDFALGGTSLVMTMFMISAWTFSLWGEIRLLNIAKSQKESYDILFSMRKNPIVYREMQEVLKILFSETQERRFFIIKLNSSILFFVVSILTLVLLFNAVDIGDAIFFYLVPTVIAEILDNYVDYVFDFDEPEMKDKKEKDSVTDLVMKKWRELVSLPKPGLFPV